MATIVVSYPATEGARFDTDYYTASHIPLVHKVWGPHGLTEAEVLFPAGGQPWIAAVLLRFESQAAIDASLADPATGDVMGDVPNFSDIHPVVYRAAD
ncbi:EthD family reductase [Novosphingobium sp.]|uniref:EthD family reductase n=1 Tax=Novosphingobium sp. TaxID=1874826 RepID=UPI002FDCF639